MRAYFVLSGYSVIRLGKWVISIESQDDQTFKFKLSEWRSCKPPKEPMPNGSLFSDIFDYPKLTREMGYYPYFPEKGYIRPSQAILASIETINKIRAHRAKMEKRRREQ